MSDDKLAEQKLAMLDQQLSLFSGLLDKLQTYKTLKNDAQKSLLIGSVTKQLESELQKIRAQLGKLRQFAKPGDLNNVPELPPHLIPNRELFKQIATRLMAKAGADGQKPPVVIEAVSGIGKSVLATAIARNTNVRQIFMDGIFWITLGQQPDILENQVRLIYTLSGSMPSSFESEDCANQLGELTRTRACLFIFDDVYDMQDVFAFNVQGEHCQILVTTMVKDLLNILQYFSPNAKGYQLKAFPETQAIEFFLNTLNDPKVTIENAPMRMNMLARLCNYSPMILKLMASYLREQSHDMWKDAFETLQNPDFEFPENHPTTLSQALHMNVEMLGEEGDYYLTLAVFVDHTRIPQVVVAMLWRYLYQISNDRIYPFIDELAEKGLLEIDAEYISLHSFQYDYLTQEAELDKLHTHLLAAYRRSCDQHGWVSGPNDGYFFENLCLHLYYANRKGELKTLLLDFDWMYNKLQVAPLYTLINDYELFAEEDELAIEAVKNALYSAASIVAQRVEELPVEILNRLWEKRNIPEVQSILNQAQELCPDWRWEDEFPEI